MGEGDLIIFERDVNCGLGGGRVRKVGVGSWIRWEMLWGGENWGSREGKDTTEGVDQFLDWGTRQQEADERLKLYGGVGIFFIKGFSVPWGRNIVGGLPQEGTLRGRRRVVSIFTRENGRGFARRIRGYVKVHVKQINRATLNGAQRRRMRRRVRRVTSGGYSTRGEDAFLVGKLGFLGLGTEEREILQLEVK